MNADGSASHADVVLALAWSGAPEHARLAALAEGVKRGFNARLDAGLPLYIIVDADIAASLGAILRDGTWRLRCLSWCSTVSRWPTSTLSISAASGCPPTPCL